MTITGITHAARGDITNEQNVSSRFDIPWSLIAKLILLKEIAVRMNRESKSEPFGIGQTFYNKRFDGYNNLH